MSHTPGPLEYDDELLEALEDCEKVLSEMLTANLLDMAGYGCLEGIRMTISKARGVS